MASHSKHAKVWDGDLENSYCHSFWVAFLKLRGDIYAELLKIKKPIEYMENNEYMLTLIDEVFSGTNSNDRITGAEILLRKLNREN